MKKLKIILVSISIVLVTIIATYIYYNYNYYKPGENGSFQLKVGEEFSIKLYENPTTGIANCIINKNSLSSIKQIKETYEPDWNPTQKDGSGGELILVFKAVKKGKETIKISSCPVYIEGKTCDDYNTSNSETMNEFQISVE